MFRKRYSLIIANRTTGATNRFTLGLGPLCVAFLALLVLPAALLIYAEWSTSLAVTRLQLQNARLEVENSTYQSTASDLASHLAALDDTMVELTERVDMDPSMLQSMSQLPDSVQIGAPLTVTEAEGQLNALDRLRILLRSLDERLTIVRRGVAYREALASATPVIWPSDGWISGTYGYRSDPFTGERDFHPAVDISSQKGRPVYATATGQVFSAQAAIDMATHDWYGKKIGRPLHEIWSIPADKPLRVSMTISIDSPKNSAERALDASEFKVLKVKLGSALDRENILSIRAVTDTPLWVDANEGWGNREEALEMIRWLYGQGVELVEQPLQADSREDLRWLKEKSPLPLIADESFSGIQDLPGIEAGFHGINIKLAKCGGLGPARNIIAEARKKGLLIMLGSMVQSSCGIGAACQLAPLVDFVDLDCNLLLTNDPFEGHPVRDGLIYLNNLPGTGVNLKQIHDSKID